MSNAIKDAIHAHTTVARLLSDALGYQTDLRIALRTIKKGFGTDPIGQAILDYQATVAPATVREIMVAAKGTTLGEFITPACIRRGAADALREVLELEIAS
jgi:hypothetical protein